LQVFLAIAGLYRQNLLMIMEMGQINQELQAAGQAAVEVQPKNAVAALDRAMKIAHDIRKQRNTTLHDAVGTWYETWYPRVGEANGRRFVHDLDDVKDHLADRTIDMKYLVYRETTLRFGDWVKQLQAARNEYAAQHGLPEDTSVFNWDDTTPAGR
jgi:hypothetical protein